MGNTDDITVLSFCTGYGGLELGLHRALGRPLRVVAVEIEAFAAANLVAKAEEGKLAIEALYPDLKTFPSGRFSGCFDFILAGYPCQPFSVAGKQRGEADERHLWPFIRDHIRAIRPVYCFLENVAGHLRLGFDQVVRDLDALGYTVEETLVTASQGGAPHKRERLFILAYDNDRAGNTAVIAKPNGQAQLESGDDCGERVVDNPLLRRHRDEDKEVCTGRNGAVNAGTELGDPQSQRCGEAGADCQRPTERATSTDPMADTPGQRTQGHEPAGSNQPEGQADELCYDRWPACPGQEQYDWEEPRTVESGMGRTVDGFASRVDELRLLGNGVVPAQAELAFRTLWDKSQNNP